MKENQIKTYEDGTQVKLSQCMIVKNEEMNIERALGWARDIACEQIVVDTGSTDATVQLAESLGAKVYHFEWINDFSAAKNYAIEQASGDWIAFLDADEYFLPDDAKKLMLLLAEIESRPDSAEYEVLLNAWIQLDDNNKPFAIYEQQRVFRNKPEIRYEKEIHEYLLFTKPEFDARNLSIIHTGYKKEVLRKKDKVERNARPLIELLQKDPGNIAYMVYLANELRGSSEPSDRAEAERLYRRALKNKGNMPITQRQILYDYYLRELFVNHERRDDAFKLCEEAIVDFPCSIDYLYYYGVMQNEKKNFQSAWDVLTKCEIEFLKPGFKRTTIADGMDIRLNYELAISAQGLGDTQNQVKYLTLILKSDKNQKGILIPYIRVLKRRGVSDEEIINLLHNLYDFSSVRDKLFIIRAAKDSEAISLAQAVMDMITPQERQWMSGGD